MASETLKAYFTKTTTYPGDTPATGLSPKISIWIVSDNSNPVAEAAMTELGGGWYKYTYSAYDRTIPIVFRCYSNDNTTDFLYSWGSNTDDLQLSAKVPTNYMAGASGAGNVIETAIEGIDTLLDGAGLVLTAINDQTSLLTFSGSNVQARVADAGVLNNPTVADIDSQLTLSHGSGAWNTVADLTATNALITNVDGDITNIGLSLSTAQSTIEEVQAAVDALNDPTTAAIATAVRVEMDANSTRLAAAALSLARIVGLTHENIYQSHSYDSSGNNTSSTVELYDSKAHAQTHDGTTGLVAKYTMTATYNTERLPTAHQMVRDS